MEQLVPLLSRRGPVAHGPLGMKEKQAGEVKGEEGPTLSKTKNERVGRPGALAQQACATRPTRPSTGWAACTASVACHAAESYSARRTPRAVIAASSASDGLLDAWASAVAKSNTRIANWQPKRRLNITVCSRLFLGDRRPSELFARSLPRSWAIVATPNLFPRCRSCIPNRTSWSKSL